MQQWTVNSTSITKLLQEEKSLLSTSSPSYSNFSHMYKFLVLKAVGVLDRKPKFCPEKNSTTFLVINKACEVSLQEKTESTAPPSQETYTKHVDKVLLRRLHSNQEAPENMRCKPDEFIIQSEMVHFSTSVIRNKDGTTSSLLPRPRKFCKTLIYEF